MLSHPIAIGFFNFAFGKTVEKEAAHAVAGDNSEKYLLNYLFPGRSFDRKITFDLNALTAASEK